MRASLLRMGSTGEILGAERWENGFRGEEERWGRGMWERKGKSDCLCIQEHCTVVSSANTETKTLANVGNRWHSCAWTKTKNASKTIRKKRAREEADLTSWPQPSHMMGFENEPIIVSDADEFGQSCWCCCGHFNTYHIRTTTGLFLINKKKHFKK